MSKMEEQRADLPPRRAGDSVLQALASRIGGLGKLNLRDSKVGGLGTDPEQPEFVAKKRGEYVIHGEIARGGMGRILKAWDPDLGRDVAIKVLDPKLAERPDVLRRFVEEAQVGGQLQHPGLVPVYELGLLADDRPYFTMKLVKGRTLAELCAQRSSPEQGQAELLRIFEALCQTVAYAHSKGVIHRDLKPANVMVGAFGEVQLVDWGLSKVLGREEQASVANQPLVAASVIETVRSQSVGMNAGSDSLVGSVLGTPAYMPPEQARGAIDQLDERADVFALGAILCELLTGHPPYVARSSDDQLVVLAAQAALGDAEARLAACKAEPELVALARACLAPAAQARPRNAEVVAKTLIEHSAATRERTRTAELAAAEARVRMQEERKARRLTLALAATGLLAIGAGAYVWIGRLRESGLERERIQNGLTDVETEVRSLQEGERHAEATSVARNAFNLTAKLAAADELAQRAQILVQTAETKAQQSADLQASRRREAVFLGQLEELRVRTALGKADVAQDELDTEFERLFQAFGVDIASDPMQVLEALRTSSLLVEIVPAFDDWASVRARLYGVGSPQATAMTSLAADLDPDEERLRIREALLEADVQRLLDYSKDPKLERAPAATLWLLGSALAWFGEVRAATELLEIATGRFPAEVRLRMVAAVAAQDADRPDVALRHISAATALRPDLSTLALYEGNCLYQNARYPAAVRSLERFLSVHPGNTRALHLLAACRISLGDYAGVIAALEPLAQTGAASGEALAQLALARIVMQSIDLETYLTQQRSLAEEAPFARVAEAWVIAEIGSKAEQFERALEIFADPKISLTHAMMHVQCMLLLRLDRAAEALAMCDQIALRGDGFYQPDKWVHLASLRARALARLGRKEEATIWLQEARRSFDSLRADAPAAWQDSIALRQIREAEADLAQAQARR